MKLPAPQRPVTWLGFDGRLTLTPEEWESYKRRPPVRYTLQQYGNIPRPSTCDYESCSVPRSTKKRITLAHGIGFQFGIAELGLTPDWLDSNDNLVGWAHEGICNKRLGVPEELEAAMRYLLRRRRDYLPPDHLPSETHAVFKRLKKKVVE